MADDFITDDWKQKLHRIISSGIEEAKVNLAKMDRIVDMLKCVQKSLNDSMRKRYGKKVICYAKPAYKITHRGQANILCNVDDAEEKVFPHIYEVGGRNTKSRRTFTLFILQFDKAKCYPVRLRTDRDVYFCEDENELVVRIKDCLESELYKAVGMAYD